MSAGMSHSEIGAQIAEKWNFPEVLVEAIRNHHIPRKAKPQHKTIINTIYVANSLCNYLDHITTWDQLDPLILQEFGIKAESQFSSLGERLQDAFIRESKRKERA